MFLFSTTQLPTAGGLLSSPESRLCFNSKVLVCLFLHSLPLHVGKDRVTGASKAMNLGRNYHLPFPIFQIRCGVAWRYLVHPIPVHTDAGGAPDAHCGNGLRCVPEPNQLQKCRGGSPGTSSWNSQLYCHSPQPPLWIYHLKPNVLGRETLLIRQMNLHSVWAEDGPRTKLDSQKSTGKTFASVTPD